MPYSVVTAQQACSTEMVKRVMKNSTNSHCETIINNLQPVLQYFFLKLYPTEYGGTSNTSQAAEICELPLVQLLILLSLKLIFYELILQDRVYLIDN